MCGCFGNNEKLGPLTLLRDSTMLLLAATAGAFGYHRFLDPSNRVPRIYEFVVNGTEVNVIPLHGEAGGAEQILATGEIGRTG